MTPHPFKTTRTLLQLMMPLITPVLVCRYVASGIRCLPNTPKNVDGQWKNNQELSTKVEGDLKKNSCGICIMNPTKVGKLKREDTNAELIFKRVF